MSYPIDQTFIREPQLYLPNRKPNYRVKVDWENPLTTDLRHAYIYSIDYKDIVTTIDVVSSPDSQITTYRGQKVLETSNGSGHLEYPVLDWVNKGVTNATFMYKYQPITSSTQHRGGFIFHDNGINGSRFGIISYKSDVIFSANAGTTLHSITASAVAPLAVTVTTAMRYDGSQTTASNRLKGYVDGVEYTDTDSFPASMETTYDKSYVGAYAFGASVYDYDCHAWYAYVWERTLTVAETEMIRLDPYQMFIPA